eukprot:13112545-Alexandrium_andersonii.AAC.1
MQVESAARTLLNAVERGAEWEWARTSGVTKPLQEALDNLGSKMTAFHQEFFTSEIRDLKAKYSEDDLKKMVKAIPDHLDGFLKGVSSEATVLKSMHRARGRAP